MALTLMTESAETNAKSQHPSKLLLSRFSQRRCHGNAEWQAAQQCSGGPIRIKATLTRPTGFIFQFVWLLCVFDLCPIFLSAV